MSGQSLTSAQIASKAALARDMLANLHDEEKGLALAAVSGDDVAVSRVAEIRAQVRQVQGDVEILQRAQEAAKLNEIADANARDVAYRARHLVVARERAGELVSAAERAEQLIVDLQSALGEIAATEQLVWNALREAGEQPSGGVIGQKNLSMTALMRAVSLIDGSQKFRPDQRTTAEIARSAWADLIDQEEGDDDI